MLPDVVFALTGDVRRNSRALRQLRALAGEGLRIEVLTLGPPAADAEFEPGIRVRVLPEPRARGPRYFAAVHRRFSAAAREVPARVYHASDLYVLPALAQAAGRHGGALAYDARELYPHVAATAGRPWIRLAWGMVEGRYVRRAGAVFTVSESIAVHMERRYGIERPAVVYNIPPPRSVTPSRLLRDRTGIAAERTLLLHQGQMREDRGCLLLADAMRDVEEAALVFLGGGPLKPALQSLVRDAAIGDRVFFVDAVPPDALLPVTAGADVGITLLEDTCLNHRYALPNKLFEYLSAGLPVVASDLPEIRKVVDGFGVGLVVDPSDRKRLVATLRRVAADREIRNRCASKTGDAVASYSWEASARRLLDEYRRLLNDVPA